MADAYQANLADPGHARAIVELLDQYARDPMGGGAPLPRYTRDNLIEHLARRTDCCILLAGKTPSPVGLCIAFEGFSTFACKPLLNIHDLFVLPGQRHQGIASTLLDEAERIARQRQYAKLTLEVLSGNQPARRLYRELGYQPYQLEETRGDAEFWQKNLY